MQFDYVANSGENVWLIIICFLGNYLTISFVFVSDEESDDDDEDDTEALMAELDQIKKERVEERLRKVKLLLFCDDSAQITILKWLGLLFFL